MVVTDYQVAWGHGQTAHQFTPIENICIADDDWPRTQPLGGATQRHHHVGFGPPLVGKIGDVGIGDHLGAIAANDTDLFYPAAQERSDLALDQRLACEFDQALWAVVAKLSHAAAATGCKNECAHHSIAKTRRNSATSADEKGAERWGCHMIPVMG